MDLIFSLIALFSGAFLTALGAIFIIHGRRMLARSVPVTLKVIALHEREGEDNPTFHPEFIVVDGPYADKRHVCAIGEERALHAIDDITHGHLDPISEAILSVKELPLQKWMPIWAVVIGLSLLTSVAMFGF